MKKRPFLDKTVLFNVLTIKLINDWWPQKTIRNWSKWTKNDQKTSKNTKIGQKSCFSWFFMKTVMYHTSQTLSKVPYFQLHPGWVPICMGSYMGHTRDFGENTGFLRFLTVLTKTQNLGYSLALKFLYPKVLKVTYFDQNRQFWHLNREFVSVISHFRQKRHFGPKSLTNLLFDVKNMQKWSKINIF